MPDSLAMSTPESKPGNGSPTPYRDLRREYFGTSNSESQAELKNQLRQQLEQKAHDAHLVVGSVVEQQMKAAVEDLPDDQRKGLKLAEALRARAQDPRLHEVVDGEVGFSRQFDAINEVIERNSPELFEDYVRTQLIMAAEEEAGGGRVKPHRVPFEPTINLADIVSEVPPYSPPPSATPHTEEPAAPIPLPTEHTDAALAEKLGAGLVGAALEDLVEDAMGGKNQNQRAAAPESEPESAASSRPSRPEPEASESKKEISWKGESLNEIRTLLKGVAEGQIELTNDELKDLLIKKAQIVAAATQDGYLDPLEPYKESIDAETVSSANDTSIEIKPRWGAIGRKIADMNPAQLEKSVKGKFTDASKYAGLYNMVQDTWSREFQYREERAHGEPQAEATAKKQSLLGIETFVPSNLSHVGRLYEQQVKRETREVAAQSPVPGLPGGITEAMFDNMFGSVPEGTKNEATPALMNFLKIIEDAEIGDLNSFSVESDLRRVLKEGFTKEFTEALNTWIGLLRLAKVMEDGGGRYEKIELAMLSGDKYQGFVTKPGISRLLRLETDTGLCFRDVLKKVGITQHATGSYNGDALYKTSTDDMDAAVARLAGAHESPRVTAAYTAARILGMPQGVSHAQFVLGYVNGPNPDLDREDVRLWIEEKGIKRASVYGVDDRAFQERYRDYVAALRARGKKCEWYDKKEASLRDVYELGGWENFLKALKADGRRGALNKYWEDNKKRRIMLLTVGGNRNASSGLPYADRLKAIVVAVTTADQQDWILGESPDANSETLKRLADQSKINKDPATIGVKPSELSKNEVAARAVIAGAKKAGQLTKGVASDLRHGRWTLFPPKKKKP